MTKRNTIGWAGAFVVGVMFGATDTTAQTRAVTADPNRVSVFKTAQPVAVDGVLDDACWKQAAPIKSDYIWGGRGRMSVEPQLLVRYAWDDHYLYVGYETFDKNLITKSSGIVKGPDDNKREGCPYVAANEPLDTMELYVGFDDPNMFWQIQHTAANYFNDLLVFVGLPAWKKDPSAMVAGNVYWAANEYIRDDGAFKVALATRVKLAANGRPSTINDASDVDTGYTAEIRLPWTGIGAPVSARTTEGWGKLAGRSVAIMAVVMNGDSKVAGPEWEELRSVHTSCPNLPVDVFAYHFDKWPRYRLIAEQPTPVGK